MPHYNPPVLLGTQHVEQWHHEGFLFQFRPLQGTLSNNVMSVERVNMNFTQKKGRKSKYSTTNVCIHGVVLQK